MAVAFQGLTAQKLCELVPEVQLGEARKVMAAVHRRGQALEPLPALDGVRNKALAALRGRVHLPRLEVRLKQESTVDPFAKCAAASLAWSRHFRRSRSSQVGL